MQQDARVDVANINRFSMFAVRAMVASGESGIIVGTREELRDMATHGLLVDLTPMIERDQVDLTVFVDCCIEELTYNGDVFALPLSTSPLLLHKHQSTEPYRCQPTRASCIVVGFDGVRQVVDLV